MTSTQPALSGFMTVITMVILVGSCAPAAEVVRPEPVLPYSHFPVTGKPVNNAPGQFQFAIMSDRTGGMLPGIFEKGVEKVNLLQPEFVLSVGDLIDGYTEDPAVWNAQWDEFEAIVDTLDMPFFFVSGNHDISNELLLNEWKRRRGAPYYHFVYQDVLFLALHTEDGPGFTGGISEDQAAYFTEVLQQHQDVRWTLIFKHRPLWHYGNKAGYEKIEEALAGRNYTLFSGHHHHYLHAERNGMEHYVLATTGGGSYLRGAEFGEFEHITWVTMKEDGPVVAHIELDGIHDKNLVTEQNYEAIQALRMGRWMRTDPVVHPTDAFTSLSTRLHFTNPTSVTMRVFGELMPGNGLAWEPVFIQLGIPPHQTVTREIGLKAEDGASIHDLNEAGTRITLSASYRVNGSDLSLPSSVPLRLDSRHRIRSNSTPIAVDADIRDWDDDLFIHVTNPVYMHEDWDWNGPGDGQFSFAVTKDAEWLYVAIEAMDNVIILPSRNEFSRHQDQFYIKIDPRADGDRRSDYPDRLYGTYPVSPEYHLQIRVAPGTTPGIPLLETNDPGVEVRAASVLHADEKKFVTEVAVPLSWIVEHQGPDWTSVRLNVGWMDHDRPENTKPSILWWRPVFGKDADHEAFSNWYRN